MSIQKERALNVVEPMLMIDRRDEKRKNVQIRGQIIAACSVSLGALASGTTLSWTSPCIDYLGDKNGTAPFYIDPVSEGSWIGSLLAVGALLAALPSGYFVDRFGRKYSILFLAVPFVLSWVLIIKSGNVWVLYLGRLLAGVGIGGICTLTPMYLAEITEDVTRGPICSLFPFFFSTGILMTFLVKIFTDYYLLSYILSIVPVLFGISFIFMPETPVYLVKIGQDKRAKESLVFLRGEYYDVNSELLEIKKEIHNSTGQKASFLEILKDRIYFKSMIACIILFVFQQFSGINAIMFYTVTIFKEANSPMDPLVCSLLVTLIQALVTVLVIFIIDKFGRRVYLMQSAIINALCLFLLGLYFNLKIYGVSFPYFDLVPLVSLMVYIFTFSMGFGPLPWIIVGEINTQEIVGTISGISMVANWLCGFVVTKSFGPMLDGIGAHSTFYLYAVFNVIGTVLVYFFVPETRFKLPHEIFEVTK